MGPSRDRLRIRAYAAGGRRWPLLPCSARIALPPAAPLPRPETSFDNGRLLVLSALALRRGGAGHRRLASGRWRNSAPPSACAAPCKGAGARTRRRWANAMRCWARAARRWWCGAATAAGPSPMAAAMSCWIPASRAPDALALSKALDDLSDKGAAFQLPVQDAHGRKLVARGRAVGGMAAVWLEEPQSPRAGHRRFPRHSGCAADSGLAARQGAWR